MTNLGALKRGLKRRAVALGDSWGSSPHKGAWVHAVAGASRAEHREQAASADPKGTGGGDETVSFWGLALKDTQRKGGGDRGNTRGMAPAAVLKAPGPHLHVSVLGNFHNDEFKNTHVETILSKCLTRAWSVLGNFQAPLDLYRGGEVGKGGPANTSPMATELVHAPCARLPPRRPVPRAWGDFLDSAFRSTAHPTTPQPKQERTAG